jgi:hypothetical protein
MALTKPLHLTGEINAQGYTKLLITIAFINTQIIIDIESKLVFRGTWNNS